MGVEDNAMLPSFEAWVASQIRSNVPFFATIMTNVGHHKYDTPTNWKKKRFPAATNSDHENYLNCILYIDEFLQSVIGIIDHAGVRESTVFVFVGDHGDSVGTRVVQQGVRTLNEPNVHVLAVVHAPGLARMRGIVPGPRQLIDLLPTITEALGFEAKGAQLPGISLLSSVDENRSLYFSGSIDRSFLGLREGKMKYIYYFGRQPTMVFDLETDPDEMHSMLESLSVDEVRSKERKLLRWQELVSLSLRNIRN